MTQIIRDAGSSSDISSKQFMAVGAGMLLITAVAVSAVALAILFPPVGTFLTVSVGVSGFHWCLISGSTVGIICLTTSLPCFAKAYVLHRDQTIADAPSKLNDGFYSIEYLQSILEKLQNIQTLADCQKNRSILNEAQDLFNIMYLYKRSSVQLDYTKYCQQFLLQFMRIENTCEYRIYIVSKDLF